MIGRLLIISAILWNFVAIADDTQPEELSFSPSLPRLTEQQDAESIQEIQSLKENKGSENKSVIWTFINTTIPNLFSNLQNDDPIPEEDFQNDGMFFLAFILISALFNHE
jgi:hypothetical protein